jgi:hypothetical protein
MKRTALITVVSVAAIAAVAHASPGGTHRPSLSAARICSGAYQDREGECQVDQRGRPVPLYPEVRCSVHVDAPRPTRFSARILFNGQLERSYSLILNGHHTRAIAVALQSLGGDDYGVPGGRYTCQFTLGKAYFSVGGIGRGPTVRVRAPAACELYGNGSRMCSLPGPVLFTSPHTLSCSVVLVGLRGHLANTDLQRADNGIWTTLYHAQDKLTIPIAEVWAYSSALPDQFFAAGDYRCRFSLDNKPVAEKTFTVRS